MGKSGKIQIKSGVYSIIRYRYQLLKKCTAVIKDINNGGHAGGVYENFLYYLHELLQNKKGIKKKFSWGLC